jgi:hypothetical protein
VGPIPFSRAVLGTEVLVEEGGGREPVPVGHVDGPVRVQQEVLEHLGPLLPVLPQVPAGAPVAEPMKTGLEEFNRRGSIPLWVLPSAYTMLYSSPRAVPLE